jgi:hypothetical protein
MSAPNLILTNSIYGNTTFLTTSSLTPQNVLANPGASGQAYKLNTVMVANPNAVNMPITVDVSRGGTGYLLAANVTVPGNSSLVVQAKDTAIYLIEGDTLRCNVGVGGYTCHFTVSYEVIG